ncbi:hypothetical protein DICPUDRAFT_149867 [Dictyostelium purpureum]|uniref:Initiator tRNA phosphoribosyl transferase n=1 Tax=Dictyostelium purpureum TaxID=5786 RepID=F0ZEU9_DICPU|nr:uncharacterized protein DICPUDRAFT_149867 [Dictyostelium purpureum]EGC37555.1 hypothetical protein DICPUDRAFT_149867 [Dictyostelium purpureum]|eukprot:XP_003285946.1 hypothetical protein DICPUDRAFT_149867 [Dictyostelium purpureum]
MYFSKSQTNRIVFKGELGIFNRLQSIYHDSQFVKRTQESLYPGLPLIANLRCGAWYSDKFDATVYFKSTDGHFGNWSFSTNRLNLHLLDIIIKKKAAIIIDSTRKGKNFPDSFSRTIPIWTCVINRTLLHLKIENIKRNHQNEASANQLISILENRWNSELNTPNWVPPTEKNQIEKLVINKFVKELLKCGADLSKFTESIDKPLRPIWINTESILWTDSIVNPDDLDFHPLYLVSCSDHRREGHPSYRSYVQGAGDDEEGWSYGLTPQLFWSNCKEILDIQQDCLEDFISNLLLESKIKSISIDQQEKSDNSGNDNNHNNIHMNNRYTDEGTENIGDLNFTVSNSLKCLNSVWSKFDVILNCSEITYEGIITESSPQKHKDNYLHLPIREGKIGKNDLQQQLPLAEKFIIDRIKENKDYKILLHSTTGKANCVSILLSIITKYFLRYPDTNNNNNNLSQDQNFYFNFSENPRSNINKDDIKVSYLFIEKYCSQSLPCKAMRNSINRHLMSPDQSVLHKGFVYNK